MRVVQLIDSLEAGGAERMAVNIANGLVDKIEFSGLVATRREGDLKNNLEDNVLYLYLSKKTSIDIRAVIRFKKYLIQNKVTIIHAHSTSIFFAVMTKVIYPKIKLYWHDHHGNRVNSKKKNYLLKLLSFFFMGVFVVNEELKNWATKNLFCKTILFIPNFSVLDSVSKTTFLKGEEGKRIVCLSNLKNPKNHITLLAAFFSSKVFQKGWTLHLIGADYNDDYSRELHNFVKINQLEDRVFFYGSCNDISEILKQANIGILTSTYEGFPVTILEYGLSKLAVISTNVGYCSTIIQNEFSGFLIDPLKEKVVRDKIITLIEDKELRVKISKNLHRTVVENYSKDVVLNNLLNGYKYSFEK